MTPAERKAFAASIRPAVNGKSDKFSWRLYKRALKNGREQVFVMAWDWFSGVRFEPDFEALKAGDPRQRMKLMIGWMPESNYGCFHGSQLNRVCREGESTQDYAYPPTFNLKEWLDVTDWFWQAYLERGRCIIHGDQAHSWMKINRNARKCEHCGKHERRTVRTIKKVERQEIWV